MSEGDIKRVRSVLTKSFDLVEGEEVIRSGWATYQQSWFFGHTARLYLTNQRLTFSPLRIPSITPAADFAPLAGRVLLLELDNITSVGPAIVHGFMARSTRFLTLRASTWYVRDGRTHYWFHTGQRGWLEYIAAAAQVPIGEPRALYS